jgi:hypothetical protein
VTKPEHPGPGPRPEPGTAIPTTARSSGSVGGRDKASVADRDDSLDAYKLVRWHVPRLGPVAGSTIAIVLAIGEILTVAVMVTGVRQLGWWMPPASRAGMLLLAFVAATAALTCLLTVAVLSRLGPTRLLRDTTRGLAVTNAVIAAGAAAALGWVSDASGARLSSMLAVLDAVVVLVFVRQAVAAPALPGTRRTATSTGTERSMTAKPPRRRQQRRPEPAPATTPRPLDPHQVLSDDVKFLFSVPPAMLRTTLTVVTATTPILASGAYAMNTGRPSGLSLIVAVAAAQAYFIATTITTRWVHRSVIKHGLTNAIVTRWAHTTTAIAVLTAIITAAVVVMGMLAMLAGDAYSAASILMATALVLLTRQAQRTRRVLRRAQQDR